MASNKPIRAGDEIFNTYGDLPRSDLLRRYGYINDDYVPYDVVEILTSKIIDTVKSKFKLSEKEMTFRTQEDRLGVQRKLERLLHASDAAQEGYEAGLFDDAYDIAKDPSSCGSFPLPLIFTIWLLVADEKDTKAFKASPSSGPRLNLKVASVLREVLMDRQKEYATSIDQDRQLLEQPDLPIRQRLAIEVRLGEKEILHEALKYLRRMDDKLPVGHENWEDSSPSMTYLSGKSVTIDSSITNKQENRAKKRKLK